MTQDSVAAASLREGRSGIRHVPEYAELGFRSHVGRRPRSTSKQQIDRKQKRFMGDAAAYAMWPCATRLPMRG
jgi:3-oxoacyl-[acyl-carrier-protein] synthase-1